MHSSSSERLLVLLLDRIAKHIAGASADAVTDRRARLRWLAERFQEVQAAGAEA